MQHSSADETKDRRDIGEVIFLSEKILTARDYSSCCIGTEAFLENHSKLEFLATRRIRNRRSRKQNLGFSWPKLGTVLFAPFRRILS